MSHLPRIRYDPTQTAVKSGDITIDFDRALNAVIPENVQRQFSQSAGSGVEEQLNFYDQDFFRFVIEMTNPAQISAFEEFWNEHAADGRTFEFWRDRDLVTYIPMTGKSLETNDRVAATYARTASSGGNFASYIDPSLGLAGDVIVPPGETVAQGLYKTVTGSPNDANIPRFAKGQFDRAYIAEAAATNLIQEARRFATTWSATSITPTNNTTDVTDIVGGNSCSKLEATGANGDIVFSTSTAVSTDDGAFTCWLRTRQGTSAGVIRLRETGTDTQLASQSITVTDQWKPYQVIYNNPGTEPDNWRAQLEITTSGDIWYADGATLEVGTNILFNTNTIFTQAATGTRNADLVEWSLPQINQLRGTVMGWFKPQWTPGSHPQATLFHIGDTQVFLSAVMLTNGRLEFRMNRNNSSTQGQGESFLATSLITQDAWHHLAITYDVTQNTSLKAYLDAVLRDTSTQDAFAPNPTGNIFHLGKNTSDTSPAYCFFEDWMIRADVLSATQIKEVYDLGVAGNPIGEYRNYYSAVKSAQAGHNPLRKHGTNRATLDFRMKEVL